MLEGGAVVVGEDLGQVLGAPGGALLEPACQGGVLGGAVGARELRVGDVADQGVHEEELGLAFDRGAALGAHELLGDQLVEALEDLGAARAPPTAATAPAQKVRPTTAASASSALRSGLSRSRRAAMSAPIESGSGTSASWLERDPAAAALEQAAVLEQAHELLGEERVAAAALEDQGLEVGGQRLGAEAGAGQLGGLLAGERAEGERARRSPRSRHRGRLSSSTSGRAVARTSKGTLGTALREEVHEGQHRLVGPVQVLDDEHQRAAGGEALEEVAPGREVLLAAGLLGLEAEQRRAGGHAAGRGRAPPGERSRGAPRCGPRRRSRGCRPRPCTISESAQKVTLRAEGQAAALAPCDELGPVVETTGELGEQAALADAGLAETRVKRGLRPSSAASEQLLQRGELLLAADERRGEAAQLRAGAGQGGGGDPGARAAGSCP